MVYGKSVQKKYTYFKLCLCLILKLTKLFLCFEGWDAFSNMNLLKKNIERKIEILLD